MNANDRSQSPDLAHRSRFLLTATVGTWILAGLLSVWFYFSPSGNLSGLEWLGSPLLGLGALAVVMTAYYLGARNLALRPTTHVVAWSLFAFLATTANMLTLARFVFGEWKDFQALPVVLSFDLIPIALGVHFSLKEKSRGPMFLILTWTVILFLVDVISMATLGMALQPGFWAIGFMAELGLGILMGTLVIGYSAVRSQTQTPSGVLTSVAWRVCILIGASLLAYHLVFSAQYSVWLFSYAAVAVVLAALVAALRVPAREGTPVGASYTQTR